MRRSRSKPRPPARALTETEMEKLKDQVKQSEELSGQGVSEPDKSAVVTFGEVETMIRESQGAIVSQVMEGVAKLLKDQGPAAPSGSGGKVEFAGSRRPRGHEVATIMLKEGKEYEMDTVNFHYVQVEKATSQDPSYRSPYDELRYKGYELDPYVKENGLSDSRLVLLRIPIGVYEKQQREIADAATYWERARIDAKGSRRFGAEEISGIKRGQAGLMIGGEQVDDSQTFVNNAMRRAATLEAER